MESTMSGGNTTSPDDARLDQPRDAVPMETVPPPTATATEADATQAVRRARQHPSGSSALPADPGRPAKGKGREDDAPAPPSKERHEPILAIGPAQDHAGAVAHGATDSGPVCNITLLLTSGSRHPYKLDAKYLARRNVAMPEETESGHPDPVSISVYTLKELILREWRADWEAKPASPSSIRLIHFSKLLDDKEQLRKYQFSTENPNVIHMSIRPSDLDDEEPKSGGKSLPGAGGDGQRSRGGANCCVVL
ncbi:Uncharacterized protein TCAP_03445 [Tolypocladium capitatum]|uniref:UBL3-like ubiquitin domain-containing protein n=1 Tax=Tolypocladium capitatum TaxID=45235 RepID=A0A2K3QGH6_9HYPO|nr:Uncharacterized protein TCAP_03445 [Tolypocladium capitatum]